MSTTTQTWPDICAVDAILPSTGVCALVDQRHVAVFRLGADRFLPSTM